MTPDEVLTAWLAMPGSEIRPSPMQLAVALRNIIRERDKLKKQIAVLTASMSPG